MQKQDWKLVVVKHEFRSTTCAYCMLCAVPQIRLPKNINWSPLLHIITF